VNLAGWRFLVFALAGAGAIVLLASLGTPGQRETSIDRYTGKRLFVVRNVAEALAEARRTGNVRLALAAIEKRVAQFPKEPVLLRYRAVLEAELLPAGAPAPPEHPEAQVLAAEQEQARQLAGNALDRRLVEKPDREALLSLLADLEADSAVARATEELFAPLARWAPEEPPSPARPDELAARALLALEQGPAPPETFAAIIDAFQSQDRPRARLRWLLRAFAAHPGDALFRERLAQAYLEQGRVKEAFLVVGAALDAAPDELALWEQRARLAGWLSLLDAEIEARERLVAAQDGDEARERLITLYSYAGRPEGGIPHARKLALGSTDDARLERPARLALEGGNVDLALELLDELARAGDERRWRERIVELAWQDLRVDRVIAELDLLRKRYPDAGYEARLEGIYRRRHLARPLAALLEERLARRPDDLELERETLDLYASLGDTDKVRAILAARMERGTDPAVFFAQLPLFEAAGVPGVGERALAMAKSERLRAEDAEEALELFRPRLGDPAFLEAARALALRFVARPAAREFLLYLVDRRPDDAARAAAAEELARAHPGDLDLLRAWIERASWAGDLPGVIRAREELRARAPEDPTNLAELAGLYGQEGRHAEAVALLRGLAARDGLESEAALALVEALFAAGQFDEAIDWLERRAALPGATREERLRVADQLFASERYDRALRFYVGVLEEEPNEPHALLRVGLARSWNNDPRGAVPFLEQRLAVSQERQADVRFYLGEAYWALREERRARQLHEEALAELSALPQRDLSQDVMVAKMLARFGRVDEARPVFERVLEAAPGDIHVLLDYADSMIAVHDAPKARELVERAKGLAPRKGRTLLTEGKVLLLERRYEEAAAAYAETIRVAGPDAGTEAELGRALELAGDWLPATEAYRRSLLLQPENRDLKAALGRLVDETANLVAADLLFRATGDDRVLEGIAQGSLLLGERTRLGVALGLGDYSGRAAAVDAGATDVEETVGFLGAGLHHRFAGQCTVGGGLVAYPGAPGDAPVGGWANLRLVAAEPYRYLEADVYGHLLLRDPAASVGLGGRVSGIALTAQSDVGRAFWASLQAAYDHLSIDDPATGTTSDGRFTGRGTFGWRVIEGGKRMAQPPRAAIGALEGLAGAQLGLAPQETQGPLVNVWVTYEAIRLLGDAELANLIPIGTDFDYVTLGARAEFHLARGLGAGVDGYLGVDLGASDPIFGVQAGLTWRPSAAAELFALAGYGTALGRGGDDDSFLFRLGFTWRW
jgi:predicted Zn-dependent protease